jgi:hypothetical protein
MMPSVYEQLAQWCRHGLGIKKRIKCGGARGDETIVPRFKWPKSGVSFPATRSDAKIKCVSKDVAGHVVRMQQTGFVNLLSGKFPELAFGKNIRTHSARRHSISEQASRGVPDRIGMALSWISDVSTYQAYIDTDPACVHHELELFDRKRRRQ